MPTIRSAIVTISDTRSAADDISGNILSELIASAGGDVIVRTLITDDRDSIAGTLAALADSSDIDLVITTGGTGLAARDNTPEATLSIIESEVPGMAEAMRRETSAATPMAMLSRGVCGVRAGTLIVNLPGSPKAVKECFEVIRPVLHHAIDLINGRTKH